MSNSNNKKYSRENTNTRKDTRNNCGKPKYRSGKYEKTNTETAHLSPAVDTGAKFANDPSWYAQNDALLRDSASFPYSQILGTEIALDSAVFNRTKSASAVKVVPGIWTFDVVPYCGTSLDANSAVNVAANNIYTFVRHMNSGHSNYEAPDLMLYILAMDDIYASIANLERAYALASSYAIYNRYMPRALLQVLGFNPDDLKAHLADFRERINLMIHQAASFVVPKGFPIFERHTWLFSHVWKDSPIQKSQLYAFRKVGYWQYDPATSTTGGQLNLIMDEQADYPNGKTVDQACKLVEDQLAALVRDEDIGIMSGDILKAFGSENVLKLKSFDANVEYMPEYSLEVLGQIQNLTCLQNVSIESIAQEGGVIKCIPTAQSGDNPAQSAGFSFLINAIVESPTPADTMVNTRLVSFIDNSPSARVYGGTELVVSSKIWRLGTNGLAQIAEPYNAICGIPTYLSNNPNDVPITGGTSIDVIDDVTKFYMHPTIYGYTGGYTDMPVVTIRAVYGDIDNYTVLTSKDIEGMHRVAQLSEFNVQQYGKFQGGL